MRNAKDELLQMLKGKARVKCATITNGNEWNDDKKDFILKVGYSENEWTKFLNSLNFSYDAGFGTQNLFGIVWLEDGSWCTRSEYDGFEWWVRDNIPEIPAKLL